MSLEELKLTGKEALKVARALSSETCFQILQLLSKEKLDVSTIAEWMKLSEPHISEEISLLENLQMIKVSYALEREGSEKYASSLLEKS